MIKSAVRYRFGAKIRRVRERRGWTLKETAKRTGVSESLISQIERDRVSPSIDTLMRLAEVLEISPEFLFEEFRPKKEAIKISPRQRQQMIIDGASYNNLFPVLNPVDGKEFTDTEVVILELAPGRTKGSMDYGHPGMERGLVLEGTADLEFGEDLYSLQEGDSFCYPSDTPHKLTNTGKGLLRALFILTPPRIFSQKQS